MTAMGWYQLLDIHKENMKMQRAWRQMSPPACPNDGTVLESGPGGILHCRFDGWTYPPDFRNDVM